jgi:hypothetical protein
METLKQDINWIDEAEADDYSIDIESENRNTLTFKVGDKIPSGKDENGTLVYDEDAPKITRFAINDAGKISHILIQGSESPNGTELFTFDKFLEFISSKLPMDERWHHSRPFNPGRDIPLN